MAHLQGTQAQRSLVQVPASFCSALAFPTLVCRMVITRPFVEVSVAHLLSRKMAQAAAYRALTVHESHLENVEKILMPRPPHRPMKAESPRVGPISVGFRGSPGCSKVQPGLSPAVLRECQGTCSLVQLRALGKTCSSRADCHVHLKYVNDGNQG